MDITFQKETVSCAADCSSIEMRRTIRNNMLSKSLSVEDMNLLCSQQKETWFYFSQQSPGAISSGKDSGG